jgi:hypothetical protein
MVTLDDRPEVHAIEDGTDVDLDQRHRAVELVPVQGHALGQGGVDGRPVLDGDGIEVVVVGVVAERLADGVLDRQGGAVVVV